MRAVLLLFLLAGCATSRGAGDRPSRAAMSALILERMTCVDLDGLTDCIAPPTRIIVQSLRCGRAAGGGRGSQILCHFSGVAVWVWTTREPFGPECAYMSRNAQGRWRFDSFPDADSCARQDG
jgi:hypothetical protein